ncbi:type II toxin-antitoxin system HicB family antitoxin [Aquibium sp. LZ166]|uniref:Type II toxin-antitoxin system HicB family antitoxin n=1 Tax=Aquibium pacificus TaxID=3153579 RepID=A0ABV3SH86_9HYPH
MEYVYRARIETDPEGGFLVTFPDVPEAITSGNTTEEARANAVEALGLALRGIVAMDRRLPQPVAGSTALVPIAVDPATALKLAVIDAFRDSGLTKSELARRIGRAENEARRILDPDHPSKLPLLRAALSAFGKDIVVSVRDAA